MKSYKSFHFCAKQKQMCNNLIPFFSFRQPILSIVFFHKIINFKRPVYQTANRFNSLLKTSRNIFLKYCGELWGIV